METLTEKQEAGYGLVFSKINGPVDDSDGDSDGDPDGNSQVDSIGNSNRKSRDGLWVIALDDK